MMTKTRMMSKLKDDSTSFFSGQTCLTSYSGNTYTRTTRRQYQELKASTFFSFWTFLLAPSLPLSLLTKLAVCACSNRHILYPCRVLLCSFLCFFVFNPATSHTVCWSEWRDFSLYSSTPAKQPFPPQLNTSHHSILLLACWLGKAFPLFFSFLFILFFILLTRNFFFFPSNQNMSHDDPYVMHVLNSCPNMR